jgi:hypothetical protein
MQKKLICLLGNKVRFLFKITVGIYFMVYLNLKKPPDRLQVTAVE